MEKVRPWSVQPSDQRQLKKKTTIIKTTPKSGPTVNVVDAK